MPYRVDEPRGGTASGTVGHKFRGRQTVVVARLAHHLADRVGCLRLQVGRFDRVGVRVGQFAATIRQVAEYGCEFRSSWIR